MKRIFQGIHRFMVQQARGKLEMVKFLLKKGVDLKKKNFHGQSPLDMARKGKAIEVIKLLSTEQGSSESNDFR